MGRLVRTPPKHMMMQNHQRAAEANSLRLTDAKPPSVGPDRSDGDMRVGNMSDMARAEGNDTPVKEDFTK